MNNLKSLADFENKIRRWEPDGYDCKLCKDIASNLGYTNLVLLSVLILPLGNINLV